MPIREAVRHTQSKDPCTTDHVQPSLGILKTPAPPHHKTLWHSLPNK
jgi:hypothetical protein